MHISYLPNHNYCSRSLLCSFLYKFYAFEVRICEFTTEMVKLFFTENAFYALPQFSYSESNFPRSL